MHFLAEGPADIALAEFADRWNEDARQFEQTQQT